MTNNSEIIRRHLSFTDKDDFYFVQVLKRRKDNPDLGRDMIVINNYYIDSMELYDKLVPQIINICNNENARAYIRLNKRNYKHLSYHMLKRAVELVTSGQYKALKGSFDSVTGEHHNDPNKTWVVDVDAVDLITPAHLDGKYRYSDIQYEVMKLQAETKKAPLMIIIPTKNGSHLITHPFNLQEFRKKFPTIDVHKDNPTILYCP
jgi:hypothetical protein